MINLPVVAGLSLTPIAKPIADILAAIYSVVPNYGVAILALSLGWMIVISPLTLKTTRSMLAMQRLTPEINKLKQRHADDRQALNQATMDLYKQEGVSPFGSCLPTLLPLPIFFALFRVIDGLSHVSNGKPTPRYLSANTEMYRNIVASGGHLNAFGLDLSKNVLSSHSSIASAAPYVVVLLVMMGTQYWQTTSMMARNPANADNPQARMMKFLPLIFGVFCIRFPAGVVVYYAMSNMCRIAQQAIMYRFDPKVKSLAVKDARFIEAEVQDIEAGTIPRNGGATQAAPRSRFRDLLAAGADQQAASRSSQSARSQASKSVVPTKAKAKPAPSRAAVAKPVNGKQGASRTQAAVKPSSTGTRSGGKPARDQAPQPAMSSVTSAAGLRDNAGKGSDDRGSDSGAGSGGSGAASAAGGGSGAPRPRTGASAGRTGASSGNRTNKKRRGR